MYEVFSRRSQHTRTNHKFTHQCNQHFYFTYIFLKLLGTIEYVQGYMTGELVYSLFVFCSCGCLNVCQYVKCFLTERINVNYILFVLCDCSSMEWEHLSFLYLRTFKNITMSSYIFANIFNEYREGIKKF